MRINTRFSLVLSALTGVRECSHDTTRYCTLPQAALCNGVSADMALYPEPRGETGLEKLPRS